MEVKNKLRIIDYGTIKVIKSRVEIRCSLFELL